MNIKTEILQIIFQKYEEWALRDTFSCAPGCATCCTRNVSMTALEGIHIIDHCFHNNQRTWLLDKLDNIDTWAQPAQSTNSYIQDVLEEKPSKEVEPTAQGTCPFLEENKCTIYSVRPFSCRCFFSTIRCSDDTAATVDEKHLIGAMAVMQITEHLDQFQPWGHLSEVLLSLLASKKYGYNLTDQSNMPDIHRTLLTSRPLPGFIIPPSDEKEVNLLLRSIFESKVGDRSVEQILNGT